MRALNSHVREAPALRQVDRTYVFDRGRRLSYFAGSDYFRLSWHPEVRAAAARGLEEFGPNVAASRMTTGNLSVYAELERHLCAFFKAPSAVLTSAGYVAPLVAAQALRGRFSHALLDEKAHPCLVDAAAWLECPRVRFAHRDPASLGGALRACGARARVVVMTDGVFARDGVTAPLNQYREQLTRGSMLFVDDAHGAGVLGDHGRGAVESAGLTADDLILTVTLSKAFGAYGGAVLGPQWLRQAILERSDLFTGNTPLPPPLACAAIAAVGILRREGNRLRLRLRAHVDFVKAGMPAGDTPPAACGPMFSVSPASARLQESFRRRLLSTGIYPALIRYPRGAASRYFRFAVSSEHTEEQLSALREVLIAFHANR